mgnify:CR=1 FL=1
MASLRILTRQSRREVLVRKYKKTRDFLRQCIKKNSIKEKLENQFLLQKLPKDSNPCRLRRRCFVTGRGRGVYRTVGLCRNMFRFYAMCGDIPGIRKASW